MAKDLNTPLTEAEINTFDAFLANMSGPIRSFEGFDGLICALICAPSQVDHDEYLANIVGEDGYRDEKEAATIKKMALRHYATTLEGIHDTLGTDSVYPPALMVDEDGRAMGNEWALGFLLGVAMTESDWDDFTKGDDLSRLMLPMMVLAHEHHPDSQMRPAEITDEGRDELLHLMANSLVLIYAHFHGN